ncbi:hypothetical protein ABZ942_38890 [Nocardia sp. NPDC046473]|uniref:hypothetical protein n=1 Tax=Nocardia sp. NPDC046473 TaxID=3155733 RepID=UPI0033D09043
MRRLGPWLTLAAVAVLGIVLLVINMSKESEPAAAKTNTPGVTSSAVVAPSTTAAPPTSNAPAPVQFPAKADYVGKIPLATGAPITLSITVQGDKAIAYACDGKAVESWLQGSATGGALQLTGKNDAKLAGRYDGKVVTGTLWLGPMKWEFTTAPVRSPAGLYVYNEGGARQSWIVDANGNVTGVQRAADGTTSPAPSLSSDATAIVNGKKITANKVSGGDSVG